MVRYISLLLFIGFSWGQLDSVVVFDFSNNGLEENQIEQITFRLESELRKVGKFSLVEREKIDGLIDAEIYGCDKECLTHIADILGANKFIWGKVGKFSDSFYTISATLIDVKTGDILESIDYDAEKGAADLMKVGLETLAIELTGGFYRDPIPWGDFEKMFDESVDDDTLFWALDGDKYIVTINSVFLSKDDFRKDIFGKRFSVYILVYNDGKVILEKKLKKPYSNVIRLDESKTIVYNKNSTYSIKLSDDPTFNAGNDYWIKSEQGGWIFDKGKISFGKNSFIELSQIKLND